MTTHRYQEQGQAMTMKPNTDGKKDLCRYDSAARTKFFNGMLLTDEHMSAEQQYHRDALRRMNRYIWGAGIVCGLEVDSPGGLTVKVHPGFALDCAGNAIESCKILTVDLSDVCKRKYPDGCAPKGAEAIKKCLMIRYKEIDAETVPVPTTGDDCTPADGKPRPQASKVREGFCVELSDTCPTASCKDDDANLSALLRLLTQRSGSYPAPADEDECMERTPACPTCECHDDDCGVCLAILTIDCEKREVKIDGACRTFVWSPQYLRKLMKRAAAKGPVYQAAAVEERQEQTPSAATTRGKKGLPGAGSRQASTTTPGSDGANEE